MTIESNLASIAKSLELIAATVSYRAVAPVVAAQVAVEVYPVVTPLSVVIPTPVVEAPVVAPVTFVGMPAVMATATPFATHAAYVEYVMASYKELGPVKGAGIQAVLQSAGVKNINETKPEMYAQIKAGIDGLKG